MVFGGTADPQGKRIAGSSNMADGGHMVWGEKPLSRREKGIAGSSNMADGGHLVWGGNR